MNALNMKFLAIVIFLILFVPSSISQCILQELSIASNGDIIHFNNGFSIHCKVFEVSENIVFYETSSLNGLLSASLSEVSEIELREHQVLNMSDSTKAKKPDPLFQQGKNDGKKYYNLLHRGCFETLKNPRNALLSNPTYAAGYEAGAKTKKTWSWVLIGLFAPLYIVLILLLSFLWTLIFGGWL
jgi:hypothetical protein